ncbi:hypothetical protein CR513_19353, partial [Mucuna pruriens]
MKEGKLSIRRPKANSQWTFHRRPKEFGETHNESRQQVYVGFLSPSAYLTGSRGPKVWDVRDFVPSCLPGQIWGDLDLELVRITTWSRLGDLGMEPTWWSRRTVGLMVSTWDRFFGRPGVAKSKLVSEETRLLSHNGEGASLMIIYCATLGFRASLSALVLPKRRHYARNSDAGRRSLPIYVSSSSEPNALAIMLDSFAVAKGASSWPLVPPPRAEEHYEWVSEEVLTYRSCMTRFDVALLVAGGGWLKKSYLNKEGEGDFIYMYETAFKDLGVVLPFDCFAIDVFWMLEVAPSQLHPNGWATMQASRVVPFALDDRPLPFYWRLPSKFKGLSKGKLSSKDQASLRLLDELPRGMSCWELVAASFSHQPIQPIKEMLHKRGYDLSAMIKKSAMLLKSRMSSLVDASLGVASSRKSTTTPPETVVPKEVGIERGPTHPSPTNPSPAVKRKAAPSTIEEVA